MEPLRIGVLGAARIAANAIVDPARLTGTRLVAVAARDPARAREFAATSGVERVVASYAELVEDPEVEAVYNPLPNGLHGPWNLAALAAGKHVLGEKPFASNAREAEQVRDAARGTGLVVAEAFHWRYHPLAGRLLEVVASGELGTLRSVESVMDIPAPPQQDPRWSLALAGGALMDLGCYSLHAARVLGPFAGGEPTVVSARAGERTGEPGVDEWLRAELVYPGGATVSARCSMAAPRWEMSLRVTGDAGSAELPSFVVPHADDRLVVRTAASERVEHLGTRTSYTYQLEAFAAAVRGGPGMPTYAEDAVLSMGLVDAAYTAAGLEPRPRSVR